MANISILTRLINGAVRAVDVSANTLVVGVLKVGSTDLTQTILDKLILIYGAADADGTFDTRYTQIADLASNANGKGASLVGIEDPLDNFEATDVEGALAELYAAAGSAIAANVSYDNGTSGLTATDVQAALDEVVVMTEAAQADATQALSDAADAQSAADAAQADVDAIEASLGQNNGIATLDAGGKVPVSQLPSAVMTYEGLWDPSTNTPMLADGSGDAGMVYRVSAAFAGPITGLDDPDMVDFAVGDYVIYSGSVWQKSSGTDAVVSVNGQQGIVVLDTDDISEGATNKYFSVSAARAAAVADAIVNGVTDVAPSQNAVFDALALKADTSALAAYVKHDGSVPMSGDLDMDSNSIVNLVNPTNPQDAATKSYVDTAVGAISTTGIIETMTAGEAFAATTLRAVRFAKAADAGFVAGRAYKADKDATSADNFYVTGLARPASLLAAGDPIIVVKSGPITATAHGFTVGGPVFLDASGALTGTAPSTSNHAVVRVGMVRDANTIEVQISVVGVN